MTLGDAPKCQFLQELASGRVCFVHESGSNRYVRYLDGLGPKCCGPRSERCDMRVRVMQPGEVITIVIKQVGYGEHGPSRNDDC